jgi:hypothetical protein
LTYEEPNASRTHTSQKKITATASIGGLLSKTYKPVHIPLDVLDLNKIVLHLLIKVQVVIFAGKFGEGGG